MHSSRMHTAHFMTISSSIPGEGLHLGGGGLPKSPIDADPLWMQQMQIPLDADPRDADPLDADPPDADPTRCRPSPQSCDQ